MKKDSESYYFQTVCPFCDKKFSEPHIVQKHIEFSHKRKDLFECDDCHLVFQSKQAKEYHKRVHHSETAIPQKCKVCEKSFPSKVSLQSHAKYVHSTEKKYSCGMCDSKFKQRKNLRAHFLHVHDINQYKEDYHQAREETRFDCEHCNLSYKQKKDLAYHVRLKHGNISSDPNFKCELCPLIYKNQKTLNSHVKLKHSEKTEDFPCPKCGKIFAQKKVMKKHLLTHD